MSRLISFNIGLLVDAFTDVEVQQGQVCAIVGHPADLQTMVGVLRAQGDEKFTDGSVWGARLIASHSVPANSLHLRVFRGHEWSTLEDLMPSTVFPHLTHPDGRCERWTVELKCNERKY